MKDRRYRDPRDDPRYYRVRRDRRVMAPNYNGAYPSDIYWDDSYRRPPQPPPPPKPPVRLIATPEKIEEKSRLAYPLTNNAQAKPYSPKPSNGNTPEAEDRLLTPVSRETLAYDPRPSYDQRTGEVILSVPSLSSNSRHIDTGMMSSTMDHGMRPSSLDSGMLPSSLDPGMMPSSLDPGMMPSSFDPGMMPSSFDPGMMPSTINHGMMPSSIDHGMMPSSLDPGMMSSSLEPGMMSSSLEPGMMSSSLDPVMMPSGLDPGMMPSNLSMDEVVMMAHREHRQKKRERSFFSNFLRSRSPKNNRTLPEYPQSEPFHMIDGNARVSRVNPYGAVSRSNYPEDDYYYGNNDPVGVHGSRYEGDSGPERVQLREESQLELYEDEVQQVSMPDVVNFALNNRDKKGNVKAIEEPPFVKTTHLRYDAGEVDLDVLMKDADGQEGAIDKGKAESSIAGVTPGKTDEASKPKSNDSAATTATATNNKTDAKATEKEKGAATDVMKDKTSTEETMTSDKGAANDAKVQSPEKTSEKTKESNPAQQEKEKSGQRKSANSSKSSRNTAPSSGGPKSSTSERKRPISSISHQVKTVGSPGDAPEPVVKAKEAKTDVITEETMGVKNAIVDGNGTIDANRPKESSDKVTKTNDANRSKDGSEKATKQKDTNRAKEGSGKVTKEKDANPPKESSEKVIKEKDANPLKESSEKVTKEKDANPPKEGSEKVTKEKDTNPPKEGSEKVTKEKDASRPKKGSEKVTAEKDKTTDEGKNKDEKRDKAGEISKDEKVSATGERKDKSDIPVESTSQKDSKGDSTTVDKNNKKSGELETKTETSNRKENKTKTSKAPEPQTSKSNGTGKSSQGKAATKKGKGKESVKPKGNDKSNAGAKGDPLTSAPVMETKNTTSEKPQTEAIKSEEKKKPSSSEGKANNSNPDPPQTPSVLISSEKDTESGAKEKGIDEKSSSDNRTSTAKALLSPQKSSSRPSSSNKSGSAKKLVGKDGKVMEDLKSLRSEILKLDKEEDEGKSKKDSKDKEGEEEEEGGGGGGVQRSRSLVAITAEENFLYIRGQTPCDSTTSLIHDPESSEKGATEGVKDVSKASSPEERPQNPSDVTNEKGGTENKKESSQSASSEKATVDQSISEDGTKGSADVGKDSGGKASIEGSGGEQAEVPVSSEIKENGAGKESEKEKSDKVNENENEDNNKSSEKEVKSNQEDASSSAGKGDGKALTQTSSETKPKSARGDVLVEALEETAKSNKGDPADPSLLQKAQEETIMPYHMRPRGATLSSVEIPDNGISTVSRSVDNATLGSGTRTVGLGDQLGGSRTYFDHYNNPGSLWQKSQAPMEVKPSKDAYMKEPREYEDYLPRQPDRPVLQRRGSMGKIVMQKSYDEYYDMDDEMARWNARVRDSQGLWPKNQDKYGSLKGPDTNIGGGTQWKDDARMTGIEKPAPMPEPIIIGSGLVPENLEYLTSDYQAVHGKYVPPPKTIKSIPNSNVVNGNNYIGTNGSSYNGNGVRGNGYIPAAPNNTYSNIYDNYKGTGGYYSTGSNGYSTINNTGKPTYNNTGNAVYNASYNSARIGGGGAAIPTTNNNNRYAPTKERDQFQERYYDNPIPPGPPADITAPLVAPKQKNNQADAVFDRLHSNRKTDRKGTVPNVTSTKKPDLPPKPNKTGTNTTSKTGVKDPVANPVISTIEDDNISKGSATDTKSKNQKNAAGNDVFSRLYQNAPNRKKGEKGADENNRLKVPEDKALTDGSVPGKKGAFKPPYRNNGKNKKGQGDAVINMPLSNEKKKKKAKDKEKEKSPPGLAPDIVVDDVDTAPIHGGDQDGQTGDTKVPIVLLQGFFRGPGAKSPHHRRPSVQVASEMALPPDLLDVTSMIRGALPVLPRSLAALCLTLNIVVPGLGTMASGWLGICWGRNRLAAVETGGTRLTSVLVTGVTGLVQLFTVTFFLVGWFWGVAWGILLVSISNKYASFCTEHRSSISGSVNLEMLTVNAS